MLTTRARLSPAVEPLESRIAPASITFNDVDGVLVTVTASKGTAQDLQQVCIFAPEGAGQELHEIRLMDLPDVFDGANLSIIKGTTTDSAFVNVGFINADGLDLGKITIDGDLGRILAGDDNSLTAAAKSLTVGTIGVQGLNTQDVGGTLVSKLVGRLGSLSVQGDFKDASLTILGVDPDPDEGVSTAIDARGDLGNVFIGGNLIGGTDAKSGSIYSKGDIGNIKIVGSILGGAGDHSGSITSERNMGKVDIGGDIKGGIINGMAVSDYSGRIFSAGVMGSVNLAGSLNGGDGIESGNISSAGGLGNVTILGNIVGGAGLKSGAVGTGGDIGKITIGSVASGGNINGGAGEQSGSILSTGDMKAVKIFGSIVGGDQKFSGTIASDGKIASVFVDGSITGGNGEQSGAIGSSRALGAVNISGNLVGGGGPNSGNIASSTSIDSVNIQGSIQGGAGVMSGAVGCISTLGPVKIGGDLIGGSQDSSGAILAGKVITRVEIDGSIKGMTGFHSGYINSGGNINTVIVHGSLEGGHEFGSGRIEATGVLSNVVIDGNVSGTVLAIGEEANVDQTGTIVGHLAVGTVHIGGSLTGGDGDSSGAVTSDGRLNLVTVVQDVHGGGGFFSGRIGTDFSSMPTLGATSSDDHKLGTVRIGGSLIGGNGFLSGIVSSAGDIGSVTVTHDVQGGAGPFSGRIESSFGSSKLAASSVIAEGLPSGSSGGKIGSVKIGGNLIGGTSSGSGSIASGSNIGSIVIDHDVKGGSGAGAGSIESFGDLGPVIIGGDLAGEPSESGSDTAAVKAGGKITSLNVTGSVIGGGAFYNNGQIYAGESIGTVKIGQDIQGGGGNGSGEIHSNSIKSVSVGGDLVSGAGNLSASIVASNGDIGSLSVKGAIQLRGGFSNFRISASESIGSITAGSLIGTVPGGVGYITAGASIGKVTVADSASYFGIFAGYDPNLNGVNAAAKIGKVVIGTTGAGNVTGVNIVAGVASSPQGPIGGNFGDSDDFPIIPFSPTNISQIASVVIKGTVSSTQNTDDHFGIVAGKITAVKIGGKALPLTPRLDFIPIAGTEGATTDMAVLEVSFETPSK